MAQPIKKSFKTNSISSNNNKKRHKTDSRLPQKTIKSKAEKRKNRIHQEYGTSRLEERFAKEFLDVLKVKYIYQFKAESIGRYYDFYLPECNIILEIDGDYYHGYNKLYEEKNPMQKHNAMVDKQKDMWAAFHGIKLIRIWEHDINENKHSVLKMLKEEIGAGSERKKIDDEKAKRH